MYVYVCVCVCVCVYVCMYCVCACDCVYVSRCFLVRGVLNVVHVGVVCIEMLYVELYACGVLWQCRVVCVLALSLHAYSFASLP